MKMEKKNIVLSFGIVMEKVSNGMTVLAVSKRILFVKFHDYKS